MTKHDVVKRAIQEVHGLLKFSGDLTWFTNITTKDLELIRIFKFLLREDVVLRVVDEDGNLRSLSKSEIN